MQAIPGLFGWVVPQEQLNLRSIQGWHLDRLAGVRVELRNRADTGQVHDVRLLARSAGVLINREGEGLAQTLCCMLNAIVVIELVEELLEACALKVTDSHRERADTLHFAVRAEYYNADAYVSHCRLTSRLTTLGRQALTDFHVLGEVAVVLTLWQQYVLIRTAL